MTKPSESKYAKMIERVREIYQKHGTTLHHTADEFGNIESSNKSAPGKIEFVFYYDGLSKIYVPDGYITPLGSRTTSGRSEEAAMQEVIAEFGLVHTKTTNQHHEQWNYYEMPDLEEAPVSNKPSGKYRCRACRQIWYGSELNLSPFHTGATWTCADYFCGGTCDPVKS